ncbi:hypothetical protein LEP48_16850 [Isoptericola sp. NEAU-Y5]|uniref:Uncharacterized protein n=1 Tax=Isoptericola luteus TaxID=2879484 RepID=A0ABS7ZIZ3_9MICO|nr:hypothetical protein [Isoptericola sp. NEAU-Y5]MCA5895000.1 hypothetical protein [Isoptericola sp. NEAU-Y5]
MPALERPLDPMNPVILNDGIVFKIPVGSARADDRAHVRRDGISVDDERDLLGR